MRYLDCLLKITVVNTVIAYYYDGVPQEPIVVALKHDPRDWFDYVQLATNVFVPIVVTIMGVWILRITKRIEHSQWRNQKLIEKRIAAWDDVSPRLNDIYCYCMRIGAWKSFDPPDIISWKREVDKKIHLARPFFSEKFFFQYMEFISSCFETYQGHGVDAKLKTSLSEHQTARRDWNPSWDLHFFETPTDERVLQAQYAALQNQLAEEFNDGKK